MQNQKSLINDAIMLGCLMQDITNKTENKKEISESEAKTLLVLCKEVNRCWNNLRNFYGNIPLPPNWVEYHESHSLIKKHIPDADVNRLSC